MFFSGMWHTVSPIKHLVQGRGVVRRGLVERRLVGRRGIEIIGLGWERIGMRMVYRTNKGIPDGTGRTGGMYPLAESELSTLEILNLRDATQ